MSAPSTRERIAKGALVGSAAALAGVGVLALAVGFLTDGPLVDQPYWLMAGYLVLVGAISTWGGWLAGRVAGTQPFVAAAFVAMLLGIGGFGVARLLTALMSDPGWVGTAVAGFAPPGALLGGLIGWSGTEE